ncbi:hypothetical protein DNI29_21925 [Hymenobacter sediminis]|uniref:hypothetical protein n=1 Tax=Hymenobacter sediminis TaxID=2218621 RepID=UPI000DA68A51|nr:hypothetical protein [Hymenobacter sediminis]RPD44366.1 hypothetical protein DNI29_21925 [Hymenobacter sediminis]
MSSLQFLGKTKLEKLYRIGSGLVIGFANTSLQSLVADSVGLDIAADKYGKSGASRQSGSTNPGAQKLPF